MAVERFDSVVGTGDARPTMPKAPIGASATNVNGFKLIRLKVKVSFNKYFINNCVNLIL